MLVRIHFVMIVTIGVGCRGDRRHFTSADFEQMGRTFCEVALEYHQLQRSKQ